MKNSEEKCMENRLNEFWLKFAIFWRGWRNVEIEEAKVEERHQALARPALVLIAANPLL